MRGYLVPELNKLDQTVVAICDVDQRQLDSALQLNELKQAVIIVTIAISSSRIGESMPSSSELDHWHVPICSPH